MSKKDDKKKLGRPTVMTHDVLERLEYAYKLGCSNDEACFHAEIGQATLYDYLKANPDFADKVVIWKERPIFVARKSVVEALEGDPDLALKYLERRKKSEFSTRGEVTGADGGPIHNMNVEVSTDMTAEELAKIYREQIKSTK